MYNTKENNSINWHVQDMMILRPTILLTWIY